VSAFDLVFHDDTLLVAEKPAGVLAVPGRGYDKQDCLSARVQAVYEDARIVHRLDMATSGLILFPRGPEMKRELQRLFETRQVAKRYQALVGGKLPAEQGEIELPLNADWPNRPRQMVDFVEGKHALTRYRVLEYDPVQDVSRLELEPHTGRTHQLRVHLLALGHPILGDALYGGREAPRMMLHACWLRFSHPQTGAASEFSSPAPF